MDKISIGMITTDRSKSGRKNYIFDTLQSMEEAGVFESEYYDSLVVSIDGPFRIYSNEIRKATSHLPNVEINLHTDFAGSAGNALRIHEIFSRGYASWVMVMEDDIQVCRHFLSRISDWMDEAYSADRLVYQIGVWKEYVNKLAPESDLPYFDFFGHNELSPKTFSSIKTTTHMRGSQCYMMKKQYCSLFVHFLQDLMFEQKTEKLIHHDMRLRQWLNDVIKNTGIVEHGLLRSPKPKTFVQHIGKESSVYAVKKHIDPSFYFIED